MVVLVVLIKSIQNSFSLSKGEIRSTSTLAYFRYAFSGFCVAGLPASSLSMMIRIHGQGNLIIRLLLIILSIASPWNKKVAVLLLTSIEVHPKYRSRLQTNALI